MVEQTITTPGITLTKGTEQPGVIEAQTGAADPLTFRRSPGADLTELLSTGSRQTVRLREVAFQTHLALRAGTDSAVRALGQALGAPLPDRVGAVSSGVRGPDRPVDIIWLGPDEWLAVLGDEAITGESGRALVDLGGAALVGERGQVVDVSANRAPLELSGPSSRAVLDKLIQLDLHPRQFPVGRAVSTLLETVQVILWRTGEDSWLVLPRASFTEFVARWLLDGMREFD
ncbi:MAG: sarcosine oxidase subunit gamma family protein [Propionibacteriaceae bacterium]